MNLNLNKNQLLQALAVGALAIVAGFLANAIAMRLSPMVPNTGVRQVDETRTMNMSNFLTGFIVFVAVSIYGYTCRINY